MNIYEKEFVIGLDIGTSSIKLIALNLKTNQKDFELNCSTKLSNINHAESCFNEQNVEIIVNLVYDCLEKVPDYILKQLKGIQLCGQMHGIVLWNSKTKKHSNLITWQDQRCDEEFLKSLPVKSISELNSGYGCSSLFWLNKNTNLKEENFDSSGTIQDYMTFLLSSKNLMSNQNAFSWGYFDLVENNWQKDLLNCKDFPAYFLPRVEKPGYQIENYVKLKNDSVLTNVGIFNALGDLQCSCFSCFELENDCMINISTSAQVVMAVDKQKYEEIKEMIPSSVSVFPYFENKVLLVAASLNGGNVLEKFVDTIINWNLELGILKEETDIRALVWKKLIELSDKNFDSNMLNIIPTIFAERHDKHKFGSILNVKSNNISIGEFFKSLCEGLAKNLSKMFTIDLLNKLECKRIIATGNALLKNQTLKKHLEDEFKYFPIIYKDSNDAALGAAFFLKKNFN